MSYGRNNPVPLPSPAVPVTLLPDFDCQTCGACCSTDLWSITVQPTDQTPRHLTRSVRNRMGYGRFEAEDGIRCMHDDDDGRCVALRGEIGVSVGCSCYGRRPSACRDFVVGSDDCLAARDAVADLWSPERGQPCEAAALK